MKEIYLHCSDFEQFGFDGKCCPHGDCHEDYETPPRKPGGAIPIVKTTCCCHFDMELITRDNCAKLARKDRRRQAVWRKKQRLEENLVKSAVRLADARLKTWGRSGPGELSLYAAHEEADAVEQYRAASKAIKEAGMKR